jgi:aspartate ammonia-lyase
MRTEKDTLGYLEVPKNALYGIHSMRAAQNFKNHTEFSKEWYSAMGIVKFACYQTYQNFKNTALANFSNEDLQFEFFTDEILLALKNSALEIGDSKHFDSFIVPAIQGGAGTSINMNVNEIIANLSLLKLGKNSGEYNFIDPFIHANVYQSTNDVVPTALKLAAMKLFNELEEKINISRFSIEELETKYRDVLRIGYTQMQEAVPTSYGKLFSAYSDALSRDWWRVSKCFERIKTVNLGGGAIGTGMAIPRYFIMEVCKNLQQITGLPITRSENLNDATSNLDSFVEVHAIIKAHAVNLEKIAGDLRLLSSDISKEALQIQPRQAGSSIMPGKINPVIPEFLISISHKVYANDLLITSLSAQSCLELNAYLPIIGNALLESLKLLIAANISFNEYLLKGIHIIKESSYESVLNSPTIATALIPYIGYKEANKLADLMKTKNINIFAANSNLKLIEEKHLEDILKPQNLLKLGFSLTNGNK